MLISAFPSTVSGRGQSGYSSFKLKGLLQKPNLESFFTDFIKPETGTVEDFFKEQLPGALSKEVYLGSITSYCDGCHLSCFPQVETSNNDIGLVQAKTIIIICQFLSMIIVGSLIGWDVINNC